MKSMITIESIERKIHLVRGQKVMLDSDLAELYGVATKRLNEQVRRNADRFPEDFVFQLSFAEYDILRSHFATSSSRHGGRRYLPCVFTEHGALMAASVLNTRRAVEVSLYVVRAFVKMRGLIASHRELAMKLEELEAKYDRQFKVVFDAIRALVSQPEPSEKKIGFVKENRACYGPAADL
jgi:hypothetical protein